MPYYTYHCVDCEHVCEDLRKWQDRDAPMICSQCQSAMRRQAGEVVSLGKESYQMKAVMADGSHVKGHFGKEAARKR
jgi:putative FmdB family regulatory protein